MLSVIIERGQHHDGKHYEEIPKGFKSIKVGLVAVPKLVVRVVVLMGLLEINSRVAIFVVGCSACAFKLDAILVKDLVKLFAPLSVLFSHKLAQFFLTLFTVVAGATTAAETAADFRENFIQSCIRKRVQFSDDDFCFLDLQRVKVRSADLPLLHQ